MLSEAGYEEPTGQEVQGLLRVHIGLVGVPVAPVVLDHQHSAVRQFGGDVDVPPASPAECLTIDGLARARSTKHDNGSRMVLEFDVGLPMYSTFRT
jgi:hypothetical protein